MPEPTTQTAPARTITDADIEANRAILDLIRARWGRHHISGLASLWASWDAFADHHGLDPEQPTDTALIAFVQARALTGVSWGAINGTLSAVRLAVEGTPTLRARSVTLPAQRHLADLHQAGVFDASWQAPVIPLGHVVAMADHPKTDLTDRLLIAVTYVAGLRPGEWQMLDREHVEVRKGRLRMLLPFTKTGKWQRVDVTALPGAPLDPVRATEEYLAHRGTEPGPLLRDKDGYRTVDGHVAYRLTRAATRAGLPEFTPYSLRRSMAVHADLLGVPGDDIRRRLRHRPHSQVYRRYIEPMLALMDRDGAAATYLSLDPPGPDARPVRAVAPARAIPFAFLAGTVDDLLADLDLPGLRVPLELVNVSRDGIENGQRVFRAWNEWCRERELDPMDPGPAAIPRWLLTRLAQVAASTALGDIAALRIGWIDATGHARIPGWEMAHEAARSAARTEAGFADPRYKSRPATEDEVAAVCAACEVPDPTVKWAVLVLTLATRARSSVEVVEVDTDQATVLVDGQRKVVHAGEAGVLCAVTAAGVLTGAGELAAAQGATTRAALKAAQARTRALRDRLCVVLLAGSGARPSDVARARTNGVEVVPGGLAVILAVSKGKRPGLLGRSRLIWAPTRPGAADPVAAWNDWDEWWGPSAKTALLPSDVTQLRSDGMASTSVSNVVAKAVKAAELEEGLTAYGFRYGRAQALHDAGETDETIAEALGHDDLRVTRGYIQSFDPFADGLDAGFADDLAEEESR